VKISFLIAILLLAAFLFLPAVALAQEAGPDLPETAIEAVELAALMLAALGASAGGYVGNLLMDYLKHSTPWLPKEEREAMGRGVTRIIALVLAEVGAVFSVLVMDYAVKLDETGLWGSLVTLLAVVGAPLVSEGLHRWRQATKGPIVTELEAING